MHGSRILAIVVVVSFVAPWVRRAGQAGSAAVLQTASVESEIARIAGTRRLSGAVLVGMKDGAPVRGAWGLANRDFGAPNTVATKFNLGSINKIFTTVALTGLVAEGKLKWSDTIASRLPDYPGRAGDRITIEHLLQNRSGLADIFGEDFRKASPTLFVTPRDYYALFASKPLLFEPGTRQQYSNAGYIVLGAIIEAVCGTDYFTCIQRRVFAPAGMGDAGFDEADRPVANRAVGYTESNGVIRTNTFMNVYKGTPAGGGYATIDDLARFANAIRDGRLPLRDFDLATKRLAVAGGGPGVSAVLAIDRAWTVVVLSNSDPPVAEDVYRDLIPVVGR